MESLLISSAGYFEDKKSLLLCSWGWLSMGLCREPVGSQSALRATVEKGEGLGKHIGRTFQECCLLRATWDKEKPESDRSGFCPQLRQLQVMEPWASRT